MLTWEEHRAVRAELRRILTRGVPNPRERAELIDGFSQDFLMMSYDVAQERLRALEPFFPPKTRVSPEE